MIYIISIIAICILFFILGRLSKNKTIDKNESYILKLHKSNAKNLKKQVKQQRKNLKKISKDLKKTSPR